MIVVPSTQSDQLSLISAPAERSHIVVDLDQGPIDLAFRVRAVRLKRFGQLFQDDLLLSELSRELRQAPRRINVSSTFSGCSEC